MTNCFTDAELSLMDECVNLTDAELAEADRQDYEAVGGNGAHNIHVPVELMAFPTSSLSQDAIDELTDHEEAVEWEIPLVDKLSQTEWLG